MSASILVLDDDPNVRESLAAFLEDCEYQVYQAERGEKAFELMKETAIDAVISDLKMPGINGLEWLEKAKEQNPLLPVIVVTGAGVMNDVVRALRLGADDFLTKPVLDLEVLHHALKKALERVRLTRENATYREHLEKTNQELQQGLEELRADQMAGRQVQARMLPEPLSFAGIDCSHSITPSLMLSGDFLEYFELGERHLVFYIADVSGHGASSAFVTVLLKNLIFRLRRDYYRGDQALLDPMTVLQTANREILDASLGKHLTMIFGVIDTQSNQLTYSVGGHLPQPVLLENGQAIYLDGSGMPIGLFEQAVYQNQTMTLGESFDLLLFSDGILELIPANGLNEKETCLLELVTTTMGRIASLEESLNIDADTATPDDVAIMALSSSKVRS